MSALTIRVRTVAMEFTTWRCCTLIGSAGLQQNRSRIASSTSVLARVSFDLPADLEVEGLPALSESYRIARPGPPPSLERTCSRGDHRGGPAAIRVHGHVSLSLSDRNDGHCTVRRMVHRQGVAIR